jgi:hypothetical protein
MLFHLQGHPMARIPRPGPRLARCRKRLTHPHRLPRSGGGGERAKRLASDLLHRPMMRQLGLDKAQFGLLPGLFALSREGFRTWLLVGGCRALNRAEPRSQPSPCHWRFSFKNCLGSISSSKAFPDGACWEASAPSAAGRDCTFSEGTVMALIRNFPCSQRSTYP